MKTTTKTTLAKKIAKMKFASNVFGLGEVAFVRWLVCRKAILPNPCYMKCRLIYDKAQLKH